MSLFRQLTNIDTSDVSNYYVLPNDRIVSHLRDNVFQADDSIMSVIFEEFDTVNTITFPKDLANAETGRARSKNRHIQNINFERMLIGTKTRMVQDGDAFSATFLLTRGNKETEVMVNRAAELKQLQAQFPIEQLGTGPLQIIADMISPKDMFALCRISRSMAEFCRTNRSDAIWRRYLEKYYPSHEILPGDDIREDLKRFMKGGTLHYIDKIGEPAKKIEGITSAVHVFTNMTDVGVVDSRGAMFKFRKIMKFYEPEFTMMSMVKQWVGFKHVVDYTDTLRRFDHSDRMGNPTFNVSGISHQKFTQVIKDRQDFCIVLTDNGKVYYCTENETPHLILTSIDFVVKNPEPSSSYHFFDLTRMIEHFLPSQYLSNVRDWELMAHYSIQNDDFKNARNISVSTYGPSMLFANDIGIFELANLAKNIGTTPISRDYNAVRYLVKLDDANFLDESPIVSAHTINQTYVILLENGELWAHKPGEFRDFLIDTNVIWYYHYRWYIKSQF